MFDTGGVALATSPSPDPARMVPGPELAAGLAAVDLGEVSDFGLVEVMQAARAMASWAASIELATIAELADRPSQCGGFAADEVAAGLRLTRMAADRQLTLAWQLTGRLPATRAALSRGEIDMPKARVLADVTATLDAATAGRVETAALERAGDQTTGQLRARTERLALRADPDAARDRHVKARQERRVEISPGTDGTANLLGLSLPAVQAQAAYARIDACARAMSPPAGIRPHSPGGDQSCGEHGDPSGDSRGGVIDEHQDAGRGMDQRRADAYLALLLGTTQVAPAGAAHRTDAVNSDKAANRGGTGRAGDPAGTDSVGTVPGGTADAVPADAASIARTPGNHQGGEAWLPPAKIHLTVDLETLFGLAEEPGELAGYGPITADIARQVAAQANRPGDRWCWSVISPHTDRLTHHGRTRYRPTAALREFIEARDPTCRAPGCRRPATQCDLDHTVPHERGGSTCPCNLEPLCRHHHRMKPTAGWQLHQPLPGQFLWKSPTGHIYARAPDSVNDLPFP